MLLAFKDWPQQIPESCNWPQFSSLVVSVQVVFLTVAIFYSQNRLVRNVNVPHSTVLFSLFIVCLCKWCCDAWKAVVFSYNLFEMRCRSFSLCLDCASIEIRFLFSFFFVSALLFWPRFVYMQVCFGWCTLRESQDEGCHGNNRPNLSTHLACRRPLGRHWSQMVCTHAFAPCSLC